jgi:hypothetical protein
MVCRRGKFLLCLGLAASWAAIRPLAARTLPSPACRGGKGRGPGTDFRFSRPCGRGKVGRGLCPAKNCVTLCGQSAHQPIRLDRILEPGLGPTVSHTRLDGTPRHLAAVGIEQRQLAARLQQAALQISALRLARPQCCRWLLAPITLGIATHRQYRPIIRLKREPLQQFPVDSMHAVVLT